MPVPAAERVLESLAELNSVDLQKVLDFAEFLKSRRAMSDRTEIPENDWSEFSLSSALRDMMDGEEIYEVSSLKETF